MTIDEQAQNLEHALQRLEFAKQQPWKRTEEKRHMVQALRQEIAMAEHTLRLPVTAETTQAHRRLLLWTTMAKGTVEAPEYQSA
jgi:hypothetical protein